MEQFRQSASDESNEISILKSRVSSLETSNRETFVLLESKSTAYDRLSQELSSQHQKVVDLRKQVSSLEQANQTATSAVSSARFREQSLQQELDLQKKNNEWLENERKIKAEEHANFRKEKNARIAELSRSNEQYIEQSESLRRTETTLKARFDEQVGKNEDLSQQIQRFKEQEIANADSHRVELDAVHRLADLQKQSADTAKQRVRELSAALEEVKDEAADEIGRIRAEIEIEHQDREAAEQRIAELETRLVEIETELEQSRSQPPQPSTPRREINGAGFATPLRPETPVGIFSPASASRFKGNLTVSQLYGEYKKLEKELAGERRMNEQLQNNVDSMLEDLEASKPEIEELRLEQNRLQNEILEISAAAGQVNSERDSAVKDTRILQGQLQAATKELEVCQQSLRDRNSQLRWLLMDKEARAHGGSISENEFVQLQQAAAEADQRDSEHLSDAQRLVNEQLIRFRDVDGLTKQNEKQLETIRNLVSQLESAEAQEVQQQNVQLKDDLETASRQIAAYQDEIKSMITQSKSFVQERDMFRNMLTRRGHLPQNIDPADFSRSMPLPAGAPMPRAFDENSQNGGESDYAKLLKDLQSHFDNYRQETATDTSALKSQVNDLSQRNSNLQLETSKVMGQLSAANQRCEMLQVNYDMLKTESQEIRKRSDTAIEAATRQEMRVQQAAEELIEAKGLLDGLRRESANLKAEKDLWKSVEARMRDDNDTLRNERSRLDQLNSSLQNLLNEREQAGSETRRRLQSQVESLEQELHSVKRKLNEELEDSKKTGLRREYEHEQSQKRIDDLVASLGNTREELATAKTTRDHLQARVDELAVELRSAEERLEVLTRPANEVEGQTNGDGDESITKEQELSVEVSELKRDLELRTTELERTTEQIEVYKGIAQSAEERLQELSETNHQYHEETEAVLLEKENKIKDLERRIEDISSELNTTNTELSSLRDEQGESNRRFEEQKSTFEAEMTKLRDSEQKMAEQAEFNLEASKVQAQIATEAQQNYENELVKHADAAKNLHSVRDEANHLRLELVDFKTQAETAKNDLEQKEASWSEMKDRYEREIADLKKRREEIAQQNTLLHGQLENLTQQITALQRDRAALSESETAERTDSNSNSLNDLQEVIKYLRREKEIVDVQYHLSSQEQKRLRQQLDFTQSQLDETRLKLDQQRRAEADSERNAMSHNKLMETLNELNLFRESSVTLRAEAKQAKEALAEKTRKVHELEERIQPLQTRISELENLSELREGEMKLLQEDRDHWQQRCQNILSKYDRVDPAELESLKMRLTELEQQRDEAVAAQSDLQAQIDAHPDAIEAARTDLRNRLTDQFKARSKELSGKIKDKQAELNAAISEKNDLQSELDSAKEQLEAARTQAVNGDIPMTSEATSMKPADDADETTPNVRIAELENTVAELQASVAAKDQEIASANSAHDDKFKTREAQLKDMLNKRLKEVKQQTNAAEQTALDELREKMTADHQRELEALRAQSVPVATELQHQTQQSSESVADQTPASPSNVEAMLETLTEAQARHLVQKNETVRNILRNNIRNAVDKTRESLKQEIAASQVIANTSSSTNDETTSKNEEVEKTFEIEKEAIIKQKEEEFAAAKESMTKEFEAKLEAEKQAIAAQKDQEILEFSEESEKKIAEQVANAQALAEKRSAVKFNMADNRAKMAQAKIDIVRKAAEETPEKPVKEVWDVAKDAKPIPQPPAKAVVPPSPNAKATNAHSQQTLPQAPAPASDPASISNGTSTAPVPNAKENPAAANDVPAETKAEAPNETSTSETASKPVPQQTSAGTGPAALRQLQSGLPQPRGGSSRGGRGGSSIPQPSGQTQQTTTTRGSGIPRGGRGGSRAGSRAGAQNVQTNIPGSGNRGGGTSSPSRGALNPNAQQFTPGTGAQKRAREDGDGDGGLGKRIRGGGAGS